MDLPQPPPHKQLSICVLSKQDHSSSTNPCQVAPGAGPMDTPSLVRLVAPALSARCARRLPSSSSRPAADSASASQHPQLRSRPLGLVCLRPSPGPRLEEKDPRSLCSDGPKSLLGLPASAGPAVRWGARGAAAVLAAAPGMYQSPRRLCSALLQRDAPGLRRAPGPPPPPRRLSPTAAPRLASPRLLAAASAARDVARSCSRTGECTAVPGGERGGRHLETAGNEWEAGGCRAVWCDREAVPLLLEPPSLPSFAAFSCLGLAPRPVRAATPC